MKIIITTILKVLDVRKLRSKGISMVVMIKSIMVLTIEVLMQVLPIEMQVQPGTVFHAARKGERWKVALMDILRDISATRCLTSVEHKQYRKHQCLILNRRVYSHI